jgi:hypothetical protein
MTIEELQAISEQYKMDEAFLLDEQVRWVWWDIMEPRYRQVWSTEYPPHIFLPFPDAVEKLREKVAEKWHWQMGHVLREIMFAVTDERMYEALFVKLTPRQRFMVFAAALNAVEVTK